MRLVSIYTFSLNIQLQLQTYLSLFGQSGVALISAVLLVIQNLCSDVMTLHEINIA